MENVWFKMACRRFKAKHGEGLEPPRSLVINKLCAWFGFNLAQILCPKEGDHKIILWATPCAAGPHSGEEGFVVVAVLC
jgi:hypothetical protein